MIPCSSRVSIFNHFSAFGVKAVDTDNNLVESIELSLIHASSLELVVDPLAHRLT